MKYFLSLFSVIVPLLVFSGCKKASSMPRPLRPHRGHPKRTVDLSVLANAVPNTGPKTGNNYKFFFKALRQSAEPAVGF